MAKAELDLNGIELTEELLDDLVSLLRPDAVSFVQDRIASLRALARSEPGRVEEINGYIESALADADAGGDIHWSRWNVTDSDGIYRQKIPENPYDGTPAVYPPLANAKHVDAVLHVGEMLGNYEIYLTSEQSRLRVSMSAPDSHIRDLRLKLQRFFEQAVNEDLLPERPMFKVFIGHGADPQWKYLRRLLNETHGILAEAFESEDRSGFHTLVVVDKIVRSSAVAIVVMTGEDEFPEGTLRARENVVHEVGFCQGALGIENTIVLLEEGISEPSNIAGLTQIRFKKGLLIDIEDKIVEALEQRRRAFEFMQAY